jgi:predicted naringenin-chalcone synthase
MRAALLGIGTAVPPMRITQAESVAAAKVICAEDDDQAALLGGLYRQAGIEARHVIYRQDEVDYIVHGRGQSDSPFIPKYRGDPGPTTAQRMQRYEREALPLAMQASSDALTAAGIAPDRVTHLVTVSCTGFTAPGVDIGLIKGLNLKATVERTHVGFMGCHGAINALRVARALVEAGGASTLVLVCAVELCSLHFSYGWNPKRMVGNALFADGAAAVVVGTNRPDRGPAPWTLAGGGSRLFPDSEAAMAWHIRDHGFDMTLSTRVPNLIQQHLRPWLDDWLAEYGLNLGDVASWAIHPGGPRVLNGIQEVLGLPKEALDVSRRTLAQHGNMSSATVLFILRELRAQAASRPCVALGFGPGLVAEALLLR